MTPISFSSSQPAENGVRQFAVNFSISGNASLSDIFVVVFGCILGGMIIGLIFSKIGKWIK